MEKPGYISRQNLAYQFWNTETDEDARMSVSDNYVVGEYGAKYPVRYL
jgi:hypothetical protein